MAQQQKGQFGEFGGRHVPEPMQEPLEQLGRAFDQIVPTDEFQERLQRLQKHYAGRPTPIYYSEELSERWGTEIYFKLEGLLNGGAHKLNNVLGQGLLAEMAGKERLIAETGAGQHGTATAMVGAMLDLPTKVYMGRRDIERQKMNVFRMRLMGAKVEQVTRGREALAEAVDAALEDFTQNMEETHYLVGSVVGPDPFPRMVREFQSVIGKEAREQMQEQYGGLPDACVAAVGGGSNAMGLFHAFRDDEDVTLYGAEPGGQSATEHSAPLSRSEGAEVFQGARTKVVGDDVDNHSISSGLDYPGVGPEHAAMQASGRAEYHAITDDEALVAFREMSEAEGIIPALEPAHAIALAEKLAREKSHDSLLVHMCGRGDKDMQTATEHFDLGPSSTE